MERFELSWSKKLLYSKYLEIEFTIDLSVWTIFLIAYASFVKTEHSILISVLCFSLEFVFNPYKPNSK